MSNTRNSRVSNVDWQIDKKTNSERAKHMFDTSLYCDCEFLVGNEEGKEVHSSSFITCLMFKYLTPLFYHPS